MDVTPRSNPQIFFKVPPCQINLDVLY
jgi:hypothetical protein